MPTITYLPDNKSVESEEGETILQTSLRLGIPHTHVCGGNARCSIGDAVNFASRIEDANKEYGTQLLVSEHAYDEVRQQARVGREFADTALKGKSGRYKLYEIVGLNT